MALFFLSIYTIIRHSPAFYGQIPKIAILPVIGSRNLRANHKNRRFARNPASICDSNSRQIQSRPLHLAEIGSCNEKSAPSFGTDFKSLFSCGVRLHTLLIRFRLTAPLSQAPLLGQDKLTRRKRTLDTRGLSVRLHTLFFSTYPFATCFPFSSFSRYIP